MSVFQRLRTTFWPDWINRDIGFLLVARSSMSAVRALASIIVPIYLALLGFNALLLGILFTATALVSAALSSLIGLLSDRFGRKLFSDQSLEHGSPPVSATSIPGPVAHREIGRN